MSHSKKLTLLIDMDGVVCNLNKALCERIANDHKVIKHPEQITDYKLENTFTELRPSVIYDYFRHGDFWYELEPIEGALDVLQDLHDDGHNIKFVTSCPGGHGGKIDWLKDNVDFVKKNQPEWYWIIFTGHKGMVRGDFLLDDYPKNIREFNAVNKNLPHFEDPKSKRMSPGILFDQPYNRNEKLFKVLQWNEFKRIIKAST